MMAPTGRIGRLCAVALIGATVFGMTACALRSGPEQMVANGRAALANGDSRTSLVEFKNALERAPENVAARVGLAEALLNLNDPASAEKELARAEALRAPVDRTEPLKWRAALALGRYNLLVTALAEPRPGLVDSVRLRLRAAGLVGLQRPTEAIAIYKTLVDGGDDSAEVHLGLGEALLSGGQVAEALTEATAAQRGAPPIPTKAAVLKGTALARLGRPDDARASFADASASANAVLDAAAFQQAWYHLADAELTLGNVAAAEAATAKLVANAPNAVATKSLQVRIALANRRFDAAVDGLNAILSVDGGDSQAYVLLGLAHAELGHVAQAESSFSQALQLQPANPSIRVLLAQFQLRQGRPDSAVATLQHMGDDLDGSALALRGRAKVASGDREGGLRDLARGAALVPDDADLKMDLAAGYLASGQPADAQSTLDHVPGIPPGTYRADLADFLAQGARGRQTLPAYLGKHRDDAAAQRIAGIYSVLVDDLDGARAAFNAALGRAPADVDALAGLASVETRAAHFAEAETALERELAVSSDGTAIRLALAKVAARRADPASARRWLEQARLADPRAVTPRLVLAREYAASGFSDAAQAIAAEALALDPNNVDSLIASAYVADRAGRSSEASLFLQRAALAAPRALDVWLLKARDEAAHQHFREARASLERCLAVKPDWPPAIGLLAIVQAKSGDLPGAVATANRMVALPETRVRGLVIRGDLEAARGEFAQAVQDYDLALQQSRRSQIVLRRFAAQRAAQMPGANDGLRAWLEREPADRNVRSAYASALQESGQVDAAIVEYERLAQGEPPDPVALNNLAELYYVKHDARAVEIARKAYGLSPRSAAIADTLGWLLANQGNYLESLPILQAAARSPDRDIQYHYAWALAQNGNKDLAKQILKDILEKPGTFASRDAAAALAGGL